MADSGNTIGVSQQILTELRSVVVSAAMARAIRIEYGVAFYHVMARGNRARAHLSREEADGSRCVLS